MVKELQKDTRTIFQCEECGFKYAKKEYAVECETSCRERGVCNTAVTKFALKDE